MEIFGYGNVRKKARRHHAPSQFVRKLGNIAVQEIHAANVERIRAGPLFYRLNTGREHARDMVKGGMGPILMLDNTTERDNFRECFGL
jgi:hypothetical protein